MINTGVFENKFHSSRLCRWYCQNHGWIYPVASWRPGLRTGAVHVIVSSNGLSEVMHQGFRSCTQSAAMFWKVSTLIWWGHFPNGFSPLHSWVWGLTAFSPQSTATYALTWLNETKSKGLVCRAGCVASSLSFLHSSEKVELCQKYLNDEGVPKHDWSLSDSRPFVFFYTSHSDISCSCPRHSVDRRGKCHDLATSRLTGQKERKRSLRIVVFISAWVLQMSCCANNVECLISSWGQALPHGLHDPDRTTGLLLLEPHLIGCKLHWNRYKNDSTIQGTLQVLFTISDLRPEKYRDITKETEHRYIAGHNAHMIVTCAFGLTKIIKHGAFSCQPCGVLLKRESIYQTLGQMQMHFPQRKQCC